MPIGVEGDGGRVTAIYVEAGDHVKQGQVLAHLDDSVLEPQVANLQAALDQARAEADLADAGVSARPRGGSLRRLVGRRDATPQIERRDRGRRRSRWPPRSWRKPRRAWRAADVRAPADGIILTRNVEVGQTAMPGGERIVSPVKDGEIELRGQVAEQDLPLLKVGQLVDVRLTGSAKIYPGRIRLLGAVIDPQTRLGTAQDSLQPDPNLRPGAFARAEVTVSNAERAVLPQTAVLTDDKGSYVLIVDAQSKVERRAVHVTGHDTERRDHRRRPQSGNDQVITTAGAFLQEGETGQAGHVGPQARHEKYFRLGDSPSGDAHRAVRGAVLLGRSSPLFACRSIRIRTSPFPVMTSTSPSRARRPRKWKRRSRRRWKARFASIGNVRNMQTYITEGNGAHLHRIPDRRRRSIGP